MTKERVQKIIANTGLTSRREAETLVQEGAVTINGRVAKPGDTAEWGKDHIKVRGKLLTQKRNLKTVLFHKPKGVLSSMAEDLENGRPSLYHYFKTDRDGIKPFGSMDFNDDGLVLLTNDALVLKRLKDDDGIVRVLRVKVSERPTDLVMEKLLLGGWVDKKRIKPEVVRIGAQFQKNAMVEIVFKGSRTGAHHPDLREFLRRKGLGVESVQRAVLGPWSIDTLPKAKIKILTNNQIEALITQPHLGEKYIETKSVMAPVKALPKVGMGAAGVLVVVKPPEPKRPRRRV